MTHDIRRHTRGTLPAQSGSKSVKKGLKVTLFDTRNDTQNWQFCDLQNVTIEMLFAKGKKKSFARFLAVSPTVQNESKRMAEVAAVAHSLTTIFIIQKTPTL